MAKNILITGANGQLGSELQELFPLYQSFNFFPTDVDTLNLCNKKEIEDFIGKNDIHYIVNCAAYTAVDKAEDDVDLCYRINRDAVKNLAEAACGKAKIIHVSTDYVFDGQAKVPYKESDTVNPRSVYGKSKLEGEQALMAVCPESIVIRTAWLYSGYGNNFVKTMLRLAGERSELNVVADQTGTPTDAADLARAILTVLSYSEKTGIFHSGIYHYTNEGVTTWYDFTVKILQLADETHCKVNPITTAQYPTKAARPPYSVLDKTKIKQTFGIVVPEWEASLARRLSRR